MKEQIIARLQKIEKDHSVKIIYAVESGSRAWGFASPDSDFDIRFIYINNPQWYFSITRKSDTINFIESNHILDLSGWDLKKH